MATRFRLKDFTLPIAMTVGALGYKVFYYLSPITPYLIVLMLFLTFLKVDVRSMRLQVWHWLLLLVQMGGSVALFFAFQKVNLILAQGLMICLIMPTATAAAVITGKLGGSVEQLTTFTLLSSFAVALFVPFFFPLVYPGAHLTFGQGLWTILKRVFPLLIGPFVVAVLFRWGYQKVKKQPLTLSPWLSGAPFYIWAFSLVIVMASTVHSLVYDTYPLSVALWLALGSLVLCVVQFGIGKWVGRRFCATISAGQALGQKNTILGIWMAQTYLIPVSALGAAAYVIWQNLFNSWQLYRQQKKAQK